MKILVADYIYTPSGFVEYQAVAFDEKISAVDTLENLLQTYPEAEVVKTAPNSVIYPGFINTHVHLEFSANRTSLEYGSFMPWLDSVIANRDTLMQNCNNKMIQEECDNMLRSGITAFGAISSFGTELEVEESIINWSAELMQLGSRLYAMWNRTAGDCLLDSILQVTWGVFDTDNTLRRSLADSLTEGAMV